VKVDLSEEAERQAEQIDGWWRANRPAAPDLFTDELDRALIALGDTPTLGMTYQAREVSVRRILLPRTHYHLYFTQEADRIFVVAIWNAFRGRGPTL
jgi:plasmid stabilization system protein ParE